MEGVLPETPAPAQLPRPVRGRNRDCPALADVGLRLGQPEGYRAGQDFTSKCMQWHSPSSTFCLQKEVALGLVVLSKPSA